MVENFCSIHKIFESLLRRGKKIENIPTDIFNQKLQEFQDGGWKKICEYDLFDAWIDYGKVILIKDGQKIIFEWDNFFEGVIEAPEEIIENIIIDQNK